MAPPKPWRWVLGLTAVFLAINHLPLRGRAVPIWDARDSFYPFFVLVADHARAGRLVSWDLWSNAGLPRLGDPEFGAFAPLQLIVGLAFGGTTAGFIAYWMTIWWLGALGTFLLARHLGAPLWGAFVVALGIAFSGIYTGHAEHISWLVGFSSLPFVIWRLDAGLITRRWLPVVQAGSIWGMAAMSAYPGVTIITGMVMAAWTVGRMLLPHDDAAADRTPIASRIAFGAASLVAATAIGALALLPTYASFFRELAGVSSRTAPLPRDVVVASNPLDPHALVTAVSPYFAALKYQRSLTLWPTTDVSSCSIYAGSIVLFLAAVALVVRPGAVWRWYVAGLAAFSLAVAVGPALPVRGWVYDWVYPTRFFRHASIFRFYFVFPIGVLAALGSREVADAFDTRTSARSRIAATAIALAIGAAAILFFARPADVPRDDAVRLGQTLLVVAWGGTLLVVLAGAVSTHVNARAIAIAMALLAVGDAALTATLSRQTTYSVAPEDVAWWAQQNGRHSRTIDLTARGLTRTLWACESDPPCTEPNSWGMITKVPALDTYTPATNRFFDVVKANGPLRAPAIGADRVWFAAQTTTAGVDDAAFDAFARRAAALGAPPLVVHRREAMIAGADDASVNVERIAGLPAVQPASVDLERYTPDALTFSIDAPSQGWVMVTDRWARSWVAAIDGAPSPVFGANFVFRAVRVGAGRHRVSFSYRPLATPWLVIPAWATLLAVLGVTLRSRARA